jgi:hypothetical protein
MNVTDNPILDVPNGVANNVNNQNEYEESQKSVVISKMISQHHLENSQENTEISKEQIDEIQVNSSESVEVISRIRHNIKKLFSHIKQFSETFLTCIKEFVESRNAEDENENILGDDEDPLENNNNNHHNLNQTFFLQVLLMTSQ